MKYIKTFENAEIRVYCVDKNGIFTGEYICMSVEEFSELEKLNFVVYEGDLPYGQEPKAYFEKQYKQRIVDQLKMMKDVKKYNL